MGSPINHVCLNLLEATVSLYPANTDGSANVAAPIWAGSQAENLVVREQWLKHESRPTGRKHPKKHPLDAQYEISIDRVWLLQAADLNGFQTSHGQYVLDVVWIEEETNQWHRETFYGVTISSRSREPYDIERGHADKQIFDAESFTVDSGSGTVPSLSSTLPYTVKYVDATGSVDIYSYSESTKNFTAVASLSGRATLAYSPSDKSGTFDVTFDGAIYPCVQIDTGGVMRATAFRQQVPDNSRLPRIEFWYGGARLASITRQGAVYSSDLNAAQPQTGPSRFQLFANSILSATIAADGLVVAEWIEFHPSDISGIKLLAQIGSLDANSDGALIGIWPDDSGNGNSLTNGDPAIRYRQSVDGQPALEWLLPGTFPSGDTIKYKLTAEADIDPATMTALVVAKPRLSLLQKEFPIVGVWNASDTDIFQLQGSSVAAPSVMALNLAYRVATGREALAANLSTGWYLLEGEVNDDTIFNRVNGVQTSQGLTLPKQVTDVYPIVVGHQFKAFNLGGVVPVAFDGYMRAVLVFEGNPSAIEKAKCRNYLNDLYQIY